LLLNFTTKIDFDKKFKQWKINSVSFKRLYGDKEIDNFLQLLYDAYIIVKPEHLDKFRGLVFEMLMEAYYKNIYNKPKVDKFCCGCKVIINGNDVLYECGEDEANNRSTVDIAGYNTEDSKFYELKVGPAGFEENTINYLNNLHTEAITHKISKSIVVGCMTLKPKSALKIKLKSINHEALELNGIREIKNLLKNKAS
jgi:hypothetical protein